MQVDAAIRSCKHSLESCLVDTRDFWLWEEQILHRLSACYEETEHVGLRSTKTT